MLGWSRKTRCEAVRELVPLRVSDDLSADESELVDRHVARCGACRAALESFEASRALLVEFGMSMRSVGNEAPDGSMWSRIEPRLGPAGRFRRRKPYWVSTPQLAVACVCLLAVTIAQETAGVWRGSSGSGVSTASTAGGNAVAGLSVVSNGTMVNAGSVGSAGESSERREAAASNERRQGFVPETEFVRPLGLVLCENCGVVGDARCLEHEGGPVVVGVVNGWLGSVCGIRNGDSIVAVDDRAVFTASDVDFALRNRGNAASTTLHVLRRGVVHQVRIEWRQPGNEEIGGRVELPPRSPISSTPEQGVRVQFRGRR